MTLKERMPRILTQVVDTVNREEKVLERQHGEVGGEELPPPHHELSLPTAWRPFLPLPLSLFCPTLCISLPFNSFPSFPPTPRRRREREDDRIMKGDGGVGVEGSRELMGSEGEVRMGEWCPSPSISGS
jgi:hypothetical protein